MLQKFAVIGHPIGHSMSPFIHSELFNLSGVCFKYDTLDIPPENLECSIDTLKQLSGFNITIPHKEKIIKYLDSIDESARRYGAVNCVKSLEGKLYGCSTDAYGFIMALKSNCVPICGKALILGCGGAARTIARELADNGVSVTIAALEKSLPKANTLVSWITEAGGKADYIDISKISDAYDLLVNATPVGMYPNVNAKPISDEQLSRCSAVFDAVYNPADTLLLKSAAKMDIKTVGGMPMLVWQAVKAHEFWYGAEFKQSDIEKIIVLANKKMAEMFSL
jgi:shikimate dehydrogenase